jgi:hypothetical protein
MDLKYHFIASLIVTILLFPFFRFYALFVIVGGFLIDIDHYFWYILKYRDFSLKKAVYFSKSNKILYKLHIFHLTEFLIVCIVLSFYSNVFLLISIGLMLHYAMDFYHIKTEVRRFDTRLISVFQLPFIEKWPQQ